MNFPRRRVVPLRSIQRIVVALVVLACGEVPTAPHPIAPLAPRAADAIVSRVACVADLRSARVDCDGGGLPPGVNADLIIGGQNQFVKLTSSNVGYAAGVFAFDVTVQNLIGQALGTTDGTTLAPSGVRVFFQDPPTTLTGTGTITVNNSDGVSTFTQTGQAYFQYNELLATNQTSAAKNWKLNVPATVTTFEFFVYVSAPVRYPTGWIDVAPPSASLTPGQTTALSATVKDQIGRALTGQTVTWGTNNAPVATVNASTGLVTAVAAGFATITATSGARSGTSQITVVSGTVIADAGDQQVAGGSGPLAVAPRVRVLDNNSNPMSGVPVTFSVTGGGGSVTGATATTDVNGYATVGSWSVSFGGATCSATNISGCSRNTLHAVASLASNPSVDFVAYMPPILPATRAYQAVGNSPLGVAANVGLLQGAFSINGPGPNGQGATLAITSPSSVGPQGGSVTFNGNGSFSYLSSPTYVSGGAATEDFSYIVDDGHAQNTGTFGVNVPSHVWYVRPGYVGTSNGQANTPFTDLSATSGQGVQSVATSGETILVQTGTGTAAGGTLAASQTVYGAGASAPLTFVASAGYANAGVVNNLITIGAAPKIGAVVLGNGNALRGLALTTSAAGTGGIALRGITFGSLTVNETSLNATASSALQLTTGTVTGSFTSVSSAGGSYNVALSSVSTSGTVSLGTGTLSGAANDGFAIFNSNGTFSYAGNIASATNRTVFLTGVTGGGLTVSGNLNSLATKGRGVEFSGSSGGSLTLTGAEIGTSTGNFNGVEFNNGAGSTASLTIAAGALQIVTTGGLGVNATGGGTLSITGSNNTITSTTGQALKLSSIATGTSGIAFSSVSSGGGISVQNVTGTGAIVLSGGAVSGGLFTTVVVSDGTAPFSYAGSVTRTSSGGLISVADRTAGNVTFSGTLSCTSACANSAGSAVLVQNVSGGTVTFSGATKTLTSSGFTGAVVLSGNTGATIDFPNGGLAITTTGSAAGFSASGGGTITVSGSGNTINSAVSAFDLSGVSIGAAGVTFSSVTSTGGLNNVRLASTGGTGAIALGGGALSGASGASFIISGTNVNAVSYSGSISKTAAGTLVDISGHDTGPIDISGDLSCTSSCGDASGAIRVTSNSGGAIQFLGATKTLTPASGGAGVTLSANGGAAIHFRNGGLAITTTNANGFSASGTGTVEVSGAGNTIATTGESALQLSGTTIGVAGMEFYSIAASPASASGISLNTVGGGSFTVTGDGGTSLADGTRGRTTSGGSIVLGSGGTITTDANTAVSITGVYGAVSLSNMVIRSTSGDLIAGSNFGTGGLALDNMLLGGVGTGTTGNGLTVVGAPLVTILHSEISGNATTGPTTKRNVNLSQIDGTLDVTYSRFQGSYNDLFKVDMNGTGTVYRSSFIGSTNGDGLVAVTSGSNSLSFDVTESAFSGNREGVRIDHASDQYSFYTITGNNIQSNTTSGANGIEVLRSGSGGAGAVIGSNTIGTAGTAKSGSATGNGIQVEERSDDGYMQVSIVSNQIREYAVHGIALISGSTTSGHLFEAKVSSNNIASPGASSLDGINGVHGTANTDTPTVCYNIFSNTVSALRNGISLTEGVGVTPASVVKLYSWDGFTPPVTYLANQNGAVSGGVNNIVFSNGSGTTTTGLCTTP